MKGIILTLEGSMAHFKRPETNNNPLTYSLIHKPAIIGFIGAVTGQERKDMAPLFPILCEDLLISITVLTPIEKDSCANTKRSAMASSFGAPGRYYWEYLKDPKYRLVIALKDKRSEEIFELFCNNIKNNRSAYAPYLGVAKCPAKITFIEEVNVSEEEKKGIFLTNAIFSKEHSIDLSKETEILFERIPLSESNDWEYSSFIEIVCPFKEVKIEGQYRNISNETKAWFL